MVFNNIYYYTPWLTTKKKFHPVNPVKAPVQVYICSHYIQSIDICNKCVISWKCYRSQGCFDSVHHATKNSGIWASHPFTSVSDSSYMTFSALPQSTAGLMKVVMSKSDWVTSNPQYERTLIILEYLPLPPSRDSVCLAFSLTRENSLCISGLTLVKYVHTFRCFQKKKKVILREHR